MPNSLISFRSVCMVPIALALFVLPRRGLLVEQQVLDIIYFLSLLVQFGHGSVVH